MEQHAVNDYIMNYFIKKNYDCCWAYMADDFELTSCDIYVKHMCIIKTYSNNKYVMHVYFMIDKLELDFSYLYELTKSGQVILKYNKNYTAHVIKKQLDLFLFRVYSLLNT